MLGRIPPLTRSARRLQALEGALRRLKARVKARDELMDDPTGDGLGTDARPPTGDDYNELFGDVTATLRRLRI